jgi:uncharacterized protein YutE (UPF0331/DUF86 family)/predicted nucleotidyltransferase
LKRHSLDKVDEDQECLEGITVREYFNMPDMDYFDLFSKNNVELAYLFGSQAKGSGGPKSDVDIAILLAADGRDKYELFKIQLIMGKEIGKLFGRDVDVVALNSATALLKYEVIACGKVLYQKSDEARIRFEAQSQAEYLDTSYMRMTYAASLGPRGVVNTVSREIVEERLYEMNENLKLLGEVKKYPLSDFKSDPFKFKTAERCLHIAVECVLDIGNHIIAEMKWERPKGYGDILEILANRKAIPADFAQRFSPIANLRNILVHAYLSIDHDVLYKNLDNLADFKEFEDYILKFLDAHLKDA